MYNLYQRHASPKAKMQIPVAIIKMCWIAKVVVLLCYGSLLPYVIRLVYNIMHVTMSQTITVCGPNLICIKWHLTNLVNT